jgi:hypothetical protein
MKNSIDTIVNRTRDLPASSAVPQPTAPQRAPMTAEWRDANRLSIYQLCMCLTQVSWSWVYGVVNAYSFVERGSVAVRVNVNFCLQRRNPGALGGS